MTATDAQLKQLIITQVGDAKGVIAAQIDVIWLLHSDKPQALQFLYAKLDAIDLAIGEVRTLVTFSSSNDLSVSLTHLFQNLQAMRQTVETSITLRAKRRSAAGDAQPMAATSMVEPPPGWPVDASNRTYRGDPYE